MADVGARLSAILVALGAVYAAARPATAAACTLQTDSISIADVPANGLVVVRVNCYSSEKCFEGELPEQLELVDFVTREPVPGSIERVEGSIDYEAKIAWRPDEPLVPSRQYEMMWHPAPLGFTQNDYVFAALPAVSWEASDIVVTPHTWMESVATEQLTCEGRSDISLCGATGELSITIAQRTRPVLVVDVDGERSPANITDQFVLSAALWAQGEDEPALEELPWVGFPSAFAAFDAAADAYCFRVEVRSLIDDSVATHEGCEEHGELGEVAASALPEDDYGYLIAQCAVAPEGYEALWCQERAQICESVAGECEIPPECQAEGTNDDAGMPPTDVVRTSSGCSVSNDARVGGTWWLWGAAIAALGFGRGRRREERV